MLQFIDDYVDEGEHRGRKRTLESVERPSSRVDAFAFFCVRACADQPASLFACLRCFFSLYFSFSVHEMASGDGSALADWQLWTYRGRDTSVARFHGFMQARNVWNIIPCVRINSGSARYYRVSLTLSFSSFSSLIHTLFFLLFWFSLFPSLSYFNNILTFDLRRSSPASFTTWQNLRGCNIISSAAVNESILFGNDRLTFCAARRLYHTRFFRFLRGEFISRTRMMEIIYSGMVT